MNLFISNVVDTHHFNKFVLKGGEVKPFAYYNTNHIIQLRNTINSFVKNVRTFAPSDRELGIQWDVNTNPTIQETCQFYDVGRPIPDTVPP